MFFCYVYWISILFMFMTLVYFCIFPMNMMCIFFIFLLSIVQGFHGLPTSWSCPSTLPSQGYNFFFHLLSTFFFSPHGVGHYPSTRKVIFFGFRKRFWISNFFPIRRLEYPRWESESERRGAGRGWRVYLTRARTHTRTHTHKTRTNTNTPAGECMEE